MTTESTFIKLDLFLADARSWLDEHRTVRVDAAAGIEPGSDFSNAVFHSLSFEDEAEVLADLQKWNQERAERGYHAIDWPPEYGGLGFSAEHARGYARLEREYVAPTSHELFGVTTRLIAPTILRLGTDEQRGEFIGALLRTDVLCCQLFSEPSAGSDLGGLGTRAEREGGEWRITGQKVWSSGAQFAEWGLLIARSDPDAPKHAGLTAFLVPMDAAGIEVRPIRQMSGGSSFNEVFFSDVRVSDRLRLGDVGAGWSVALTTLGFERDHADSGGPDGRTGGSWEQVIATARALGRAADPLVRQQLASLYGQLRIEEYANQRAADLRVAGALPGPEGSLSKLLWTEGMRRMSDVVSLIVGPALVADTGQWATYAWGEHVLGAPGYRIAGGSDEIQRNIIAERVLGLPGEPRVDKGVPWRAVPRS
jgi:alkylation response protein AidB-like acyl-CoA dehydrogenase